MARIRTVFADNDQQRRKPVRDGSEFLALAIDLPGADIGAAGHLANPRGARGNNRPLLSLRAAPRR